MFGIKKRTTVTFIVFYVGVSICLTSTGTFATPARKSKNPVTLPPPPPEDPKVKECKAGISSLMKRSLSLMLECRKSVTVPGNDAGAKMTCIGKCVFMKEGILTPGGLIEVDTAQKYADTQVPEVLKPMIVLVMAPCFKASYGHLDPMDPLCASYEPLLKCVMDSLPKLCGISDNPYKI